MGWEIQGGSLGFVVERGGYLGINLINIISRTPDYEFSQRIGDSANPESFNEFSEASIANGLQDGWAHSLANELHVVGRIVLNLWRLMRSEVKLNMFSIEAVTEEVLRRKIPSIPCKVLNHWFSRGTGRLRYRCIEHIIKMTKLNLEIINQLDMVETITFYHIFTDLDLSLLGVIAIGWQYLLIMISNLFITLDFAFCFYF